MSPKNATSGSTWTDVGSNLSAIFDWYAEDFLEWLVEERPEEEVSILDYVTLYLPLEKAVLLATDGPPLAVEYVDYDWRLNDQALAD